MESYDIVIIGAGPAGLMAAGHASELGARVLVLEKNSQAGIKLLMTGGGRCNFTNSASIKTFAASFGPKGSWLLSGLSVFNSNDILKFFSDRNIKSQVNEEGKIYPENNSAKSIKNVLVDYVESNGGKILFDSKVNKIVKKNNIIDKLILSNGTEIRADKYIIACGGNTYPKSGSSGDAYIWLKELGHKIIKPRPALSPIIIKDANTRILEGLSFSNVQLALYKDNYLVAKESGDLIFTLNGLSGPVALNLSRLITLQDKSHLTIKIDYFFQESKEELHMKIRDLIKFSPRESIRNILSKLILKRFVDFVLMNVDIDDSKKGADITKSDTILIVNFLKEMNLQVLDIKGFDEAMITSGGVDLREVNQRTMASKIFTNLYFAGEILDLDGPTGGFNLQVCWTTGYLAGESAALSK